MEEFCRIFTKHQSPCLMFIFYLHLYIEHSSEAFLFNPNHFTAYPMGLPVWDTVRLTIEGIDGLEGTSAGKIFIFVSIYKFITLFSPFFSMFPCLYDMYGCIIVAGGEYVV